jgi:predicted nucleic acid-binding Zn ribbon protein
MKITTSHCLECNKPLKGRIDKKFCDDSCRNAFNNKINSNQHEIVKKINNILKKNRKILEDIFPQQEEMYKTTKQRLLEKGFSFQYITHTYTNKKGNIYFFCYEYGYLPLENDWYLLVKRKEE